MRYRGAVDTPQSNTIRGWAVTANGESCEISVVVNGGMPVLVSSDKLRPDLEKGGISKGAGGFAVDVSTLLKRGANRIELFFPDGSLLPGAPIQRESIEDPVPAAAVTGYRGFLDQAVGGKISGWAVTNFGDPCTLRVELDGDLIATAESDQPRADLAKGKVSRGLGGFRVDISKFLKSGPNNISVVLPSNEHVNGSPFIEWIGKSGGVMGVEVEEAHPEDTPGPDVFSSAKKTPSLTSEGLGTQPDQFTSGPDKLPGTLRPAKDNKRKAPSSQDVAHPVNRAQNIAEQRGDKTADEESSNKMPTLTQLDELSLDDLALAVASGAIEVPPVPAPPPLPEPVVEDEEQPAEQEPPQPEAKKSLFSKLFGGR